MCGLVRVSAAVNTILQKLCTILGFFKDLLTIEHLSDSCILQLLRTSFTTLLVDNIQLLQLKAISLIGGVLKYMLSVLCNLLLLQLFFDCLFGLICLVSCYHECRFFTHTRNIELT